MRFRPILLALALLAGCSDQGTIESNRLSDLTVGQTTSTELTSLWGPPLRDATMPDGRHVWTYRTIHLQTGPTVAFAPGFGPIGSTTDTVMGQVTLTFDDKGVLLSYAYTK